MGRTERSGMYPESWTYLMLSAAIFSFMSVNSCARRSLIPAFPRCRWSNAVKSTTSLPVCHTLRRNISGAAGKCSHDRVKMSRLISDYSAFLWCSSTSLLQLCSRPVIPVLLHQQGIRRDCWFLCSPFVHQSMVNKLMNCCHPDWSKQLWLVSRENKAQDSDCILTSASTDRP